MEAALWDLIGLISIRLGGQAWLKGLITKGSSGSGLELNRGRPPARNLRGADQKYQHPQHLKGSLKEFVAIWGLVNPTRPSLVPVRLQGLMWLILTPPAPSAGCRLKGLIPQMQKRIKPSKGLICTLTSTQTIKVGLISAANSPQPIQRVGLKGFSHV